MVKMFNEIMMLIINGIDFDRLCFLLFINEKVLKFNKKVIIIFVLKVCVVVIFGFGVMILKLFCWRFFGVKVRSKLYFVIVFIVCDVMYRKYCISFIWFVSRNFRLMVGFMWFLFIVFKVVIIVVIKNLVFKVMWMLDIGGLFFGVSLVFIVIKYSKFVFRNLVKYVC